MKPTTTESALAGRADALATAACELYDAVTDPAALTADVLEDVFEALQTTAAAMVLAYPEAKDVLRTVTRLRSQLSLDEHHQEQPVAPVPSVRARRTGVTRRGLGPGYRGVQIPRGRAAMW